MYKTQNNTYTANAKAYLITSSNYQRTKEDSTSYKVFTAKPRMKPCTGKCGRCDCYN